MKILYMGTAAYDAIPAPFCTCETCRQAFKLGGKELRTRTQALINDDLLIDFNGDTVSHFMKYNIDTTKIKSCLITHSHSDHIYPEDIVIPQYTSSGVSVDFYSAKDGYEKIIRAGETSDAPETVKKYIKAHEIFEGEKFVTNGYTVLPLPANHDKLSTPVIYAIEKDGKRLLYALDTGVFSDRVFELLNGYGKFNLITFDCTGGLDKAHPWLNGHMKLERNLAMLEKLKELGVADEKTKVVVTHFSHNGATLYKDIAKVAEKYSVTVAYDGLEVEF